MGSPPRSPALLEIRLRASAPSGASIVRAATYLVSCGAAPDALVRSEARGVVRLCAYVRPWSPAARRWLRAARRPAGWTATSRLLRGADWLTKWQTDYRISPLGRTLTVVPLWRKGEYRGKKPAVYLDPRGSFGSGTHETTRLVVRQMEALRGRFDSFLDAGTGTGVLLVAAARLGARRLAGLDEDPQALRTARANLRHNGIRGARLKHADIRRPRRGAHDLVAANLLSRVLAEAAPRLAACVRPGGHLVVSGIERSNLAWFGRHFRNPRLRRLRTALGRRWAAVLYRRI